MGARRGWVGLEGWVVPIDYFDLCSWGGGGEGFVVIILDMSKMSTLLFFMFDLIAPFLYCHEGVCVDHGSVDAG